MHHFSTVHGAGGEVWLAETVSQIEATGIHNLFAFLERVSTRSQAQGFLKISGIPQPSLMDLDRLSEAMVVSVSGNLAPVSGRGRRSTPTYSARAVEGGQGRQQFDLVGNGGGAIGKEEGDKANGDRQGLFAGSGAPSGCVAPTLHQWRSRQTIVGDGISQLGGSPHSRSTGIRCPNRSLLCGWGQRHTLRCKDGNDSRISPGCPACTRGSENGLVRMKWSACEERRR